MRRALVLGLPLALCVGANALFGRFRSPNEDPVGLRLSPETAVETASFFAVGMRRLAADLGLIRLIIYYGSPEEDEEHGHGHEGFDPDHPERHYGGGKYPEIAARAMRVLDLDASYTYAACYAAGALAFNLSRPQEALDLLRYALSRDPKNLQYQSYIGAIGSHRNGDAAGVIRLLEPLLVSPDCPTMIKSIVAFLYKKTGRLDDAVALYRDIFRNSRDEGYRATAKRRLGELGLEP